MRGCTSGTAPARLGARGSPGTASLYADRTRAVPPWSARFCYSPAGGGESGRVGGVSVWLMDREAAPDLMCG